MGTMFDKIVSLVMGVIALAAIALALTTWHNWQNGQANVDRLEGQLTGLQLRIRQISKSKPSTSPNQSIISLAPNGHNVSEIVIV